MTKKKERNLLVKKFNVFNQPVYYISVIMSLQAHTFSKNISLLIVVKLLKVPSENLCLFT